MKSETKQQRELQTATIALAELHRRRSDYTDDQMRWRLDELYKLIDEILLPDNKLNK